MPSLLSTANAVCVAVITLSAAGSILAAQASSNRNLAFLERSVPVTEVPNSPEAACFCGETWSAEDNFNTDYWHWDMDGKDVAYSVVIPAGSRLVVTIYPNSCWDPGLYLADHSGHAATSGFASDMHYTAQPETLVIDRQPVERTRYVVVDSYSPGMCGSYDICFTLESPGSEQEVAWSGIKRMLE